jgi:hypothetical protein
MQRLCLLAFACFFSAMAWGQDTAELNQCTSIKENARRLRCFDKAAAAFIEAERQRQIKEEVDRRVRDIEVAARLEAAEKEAKGKAAVDAALEAKTRAEEVAALKAKQQRFAATANDALRALRRLTTRIETGISYRDYSPALSEAKLEVRTFADGAHASTNPELTERLGIAIAHFDLAHVVWQERFRSYGRPLDLLYDQNLSQRLAAAYPAMDSAKDSSTGRLLIQAAVTVIFKSAAQEVDAAASIIRKFE